LWLPELQSSDHIELCSELRCNSAQTRDEKVDPRSLLRLRPSFKPRADLADLIGSPRRSPVLCSAPAFKESFIEMYDWRLRWAMWLRTAITASMVR
jgi:hypothetical protein